MGSYAAFVVVLFLSFFSGEGRGGGGGGGGRGKRLVFHQGRLAFFRHFPVFSEKGELS